MRSLIVAASLLAAVPVAAQQAPRGDTSPFRVAARFLENCDARAGADGQRPPENYGCLSYMAGLVEGYSVAAYANGDKHPYCLPRPVTLVEMMDMMAVAIERGVPGDTPTAAVFHNLLTVTFPCNAATVPLSDDTPGEAPAGITDTPATDAADTPSGTSGGAAPSAR